MNTVTERDLYPGRHRGQRNHALDVAKKNGTPHVPKHSTNRPATDGNVEVAA